MTSDVAVWRVRCLQARGRGRALSERDESSGREPASHQPISLPDLWLMIDGLAALWGARVCTISASSVPWLELDGLAHRLSSPLASALRVEKLLHRKDGAPRQHGVDRQPDLMGEDRERF